MPNPEYIFIHVLLRLMWSKITEKEAKLEYQGNRYYCIAVRRKDDPENQFFTLYRGGVTQPMRWARTYRLFTALIAKHGSNNVKIFEYEGDGSQINKDRDINFRYYYFLHDAGNDAYQHEYLLCESRGGFVPSKWEHKGFKFPGLAIDLCKNYNEVCSEFGRNNVFIVREIRYKEEGGQITFDEEESIEG